METVAKHSACTQTNHAHHQLDSYDLDEVDMAFDPTLASCCERDEQEYKKAMKVKAVLTANDPTSGAVRMRQQLFTLPPIVTQQPLVLAPQVSQLKQALISDSESDVDDFDESDDDLSMEVMLAARRQELEKQIQNAKQNIAEGYGVALDAELSQLVQELRNEPEVPRVALVVDNSAAKTAQYLRAMRNKMTEIAQRFLGTKFYIVISARDDESLRVLRIGSAPALAAFRRGECVNSLALDLKAILSDLDVLWEARYLPWLIKSNVLTNERQILKGCQNKASRKEIIKKDESEPKDESEHEGFDCGVKNCRLRFGYEHEHVGSSQLVKDEIASWRQTLNK
ncbi:hypothetical protein CCR75_002680 [Bremia lactucae]|uniref:Phosducin thioredoxin-like domain-containing protein n=1 Tax=Bremia lactucae TaxID=4779 RepID=A0A976IH40_BRELC|nr:hypothetical protein CCR75_002680 [Bremia lactucae]